MKDTQTKARPILTFWSQIKSVLSGEELSSHEDHVPRNRLKMLETRTEAGLLTSDQTQEGRSLPGEGLASQRQSVADNQVRWSCNPDKGMQQKIRQAHEMGGVTKGFSIDPLIELQ